MTRTAAPGAAATARRRVRLLTPPTPSRSRGTAAAGQLEELCAGALGTGAPVVALACRLADLVPPRLVPLLDTTVALPPMGFGQFARLARIVLGGSNRLRPRSFESQRTVLPIDLMVSLRPYRSSARALDDLMRLTRRGGTGSPPEIGIQDLHGMGALVEWAEAAKADLALYRTGRLPWRAMPRGALLSGPSGVGKTFSARVVAAHLEVPLVAGAMGRWLGVGDGNLGDFCGAMNKTFDEARANAPVLLVIDEVDSLPSREIGHHPWWAAAVNALLEQLDGLEGREGVIVMAMCNHRTCAIRP